MALIEIKVPDIGDFSDVSVIELLVKPGDSVKKEQSLITVESDKASMEIPCSASGVIRELKVKLGDKVHEGSVLLMLETSSEHSSSSSSEPTSSIGAPSTPKSIPGASQVMSPETKDGSLAKIRVEVKIPDIGDFKDVSVIELLAKTGDRIEETNL